MAGTVFIRSCIILCLLIHTAMCQECSQPCDCPAESPLCPVGTSLVLDGCSCCKVCARQAGEPCSFLEPCDHHKDLYCDYGVLSDTETGICMAQEGQTCDLGGVIYRSGETFQPSCKHQCVCMNGEIGCVPTCASNIRLPSPDCPYPRRVQIPGKCCEEWVCDQIPQEDTFQSAMAGRSIAYREITDQSVQPESARDNCIVQTTEWSECSATCGMGLSSRVTNDNEQCQLERQTRMCMIRPCHAELEKDIKRGKKCVRTPKSQRAMRFELSGCQSVRLYKPKFCGVCTDGRCCTPHATATVEVEFRCSEGDTFRKRMMFIKTCSCHHDCPRENDIFLASHSRRMIGDYDNDM
ncbi:CCN family member 2b isoform X1 [Megalobrama amblycephala]|uniref:CCN family member 3 n=1 Tax=Megalobrama amblycephala TaxID=75352 RepID=A0A0A7HRV2_MEGAM|nr:CCN family member 2b isoform X1 [Megalobrama amblycephala]AIZ09083.1 connective tissue growth factor b [Megalobrama amblycephala]